MLKISTSTINLEQNLPNPSVQANETAMRDRVELSIFIPIEPLVLD
jgi:hypothetical protein